MMPIYEYHCPNCRRKVSLFNRRVSPPGRPRCPHCSTTDLQRVFSRFAVLHSEEKLVERRSDLRTYGDVNLKDPSSVEGWVKRIGKSIGDEDLGPMAEEAVQETIHGSETEE